MRRVLLAGLAGALCLAVVVPPRSCAALRMGPVPISQRVAQADVVVVGKVAVIDDKTVKSERFPNDQMTGEYKVATIKVSEGLGVNGLSTIKVGFLPTAPVKPIRPGRPALPSMPDINLAKGQQVCLFLRQHHKEDFYVAVNSFAGLLDRKSPTYAKDLAEVKRVCKLLAKPTVNLKSRSAAVRFETAGLLVQRYRTFRPKAKQEPIEAEESKLILQAIANSNWNVRTPPLRLGQPVPMTPQGLFRQLGVQPQDGWTPPLDFRLYNAAAKKWLKDNADTFLIKRYVQATDK
jgi:hypothetical protein